MNVNDLRIVVTILSFVCFAGIVAWALARQNRARFEEAALLPFADDTGPAATAPRGDRT